MSGEPDRGSLSQYVEAAVRRKWTILLPTLLVSALLIFQALSQQSLYDATAEVVVNQQNVVRQLLTGIPESASDPQRGLETQARIARSPAVAAFALERARIKVRTPLELVRNTTVAVVPSADILRFTVTDPDSALVARLTTAYATGYTEYRRRTDTAAVETTRRELQQRLSQFTTPQDRRSPAYAELLNREQQLRVVASLQAANAYLLRAANGYAQVQPRPVQRGVIGLVLGLGLGLALALLWEALDTRVRSAEEVAERLGLPLLARVPHIPRRMRGQDRVVALREPHGATAESFRILANNLEFVKLDRKTRSIVVTSATVNEGKSMVAANLAATLARGGRHVAVIDLDLREPMVAEIFGVASSPGVTDVALRRVRLEEALVSIAIADSGGRVRGRADGEGSPNGSGDVRGVLEVLPSGERPPNPGELVASEPVRKLVESLQERVDLVVIDTPPMTVLGDALALAGWVDAILPVTRLSVASRPVLAEFRRVLDTSRAIALGVVVTGVEGAGVGGPSYRPPKALRPKAPAKVGA